MVQRENKDPSETLGKKHKIREGSDYEVNRRRSTKKRRLGSFLRGSGSDINDSKVFLEKALCPERERKDPILPIILRTNWKKACNAPRDYINY